MKYDNSRICQPRQTINTPDATVELRSSILHLGSYYCLDCGQRLNDLEFEMAQEHCDGCRAAGYVTTTRPCNGQSPAGAGDEHSAIDHRDYMPYMGWFNWLMWGAVAIVALLALAACLAIWW